MAAKKGSKNKYLKEFVSEDEKKVVSTRVPVSVADAFNRAIEIASKHNSKLALTDVVETALRDAIMEVEEAFSVDCYTVDMIDALDK